jgi:transposase
VTAFTYGPLHHRSECSCGEVGPSRLRVGRAVIDALLHAARTGCALNAPVHFDARGVVS